MAMLNQTLSHFGAYSSLLVYELMSRSNMAKYQQLGNPFLAENDTIRWAAAAHIVDKNTMYSCPLMGMSHR